MKCVVVCLLLLVYSAQAADISKICGYAQRRTASWREALSGDASNYMIGGSETSTDEFPWMVSLRRRTAEDKVSSHFCGGSIISEKYVVTAAHCLEPSMQSAKARALPVVVLYFTPNGKMAIKEIKKVHFHPTWNPKILDSDMAIIELKEAFDFDGEDNNLKPICLPEVVENIENWYNCMSAGWGVTSYGSKQASKSLLKADMRIVPKDICRQSYKALGAVTNRMFCAGDPKAGLKSTCQGDSGGPLMCLRKDKRYQLSGITSWGFECGKPNFPAVFADVSQLILFIRQVTGL